MTTLCTECKIHPVHIKKRQLCSKCYQRFYRSRWRRGETIINPLSKLSAPTARRYQHQGELDFVRNFFLHKKWYYHPATFHLDGTTYSPDFYDADRNVWIEVSATRQAYDQGKRKYDLFQKLYPLLNFEIRSPTGELLEDLEKNKQKWAYQLNKYQANK